MEVMDGILLFEAIIRTKSINDCPLRKFAFLHPVVVSAWQDPLFRSETTGEEKFPNSCL